MSFFENLARDYEKRAVLTSPRKGHLFVGYSRSRADGPVISMHENLWVVTFEEDGRWGIKVRSC